MLCKIKLWILCFCFSSLTSLAQEKETVIFLKNIDAVGDVAKIQKAISYTKNTKERVRIVFESKEYRIRMDENMYLIPLKDKKNVVLDFNHAVFILESYTKFLNLERVENLELKNAVIDYANLPFSQGIVTSVSKDKRILTVSVDAGFPSIQRIMNHTDLYYGMLNEKVNGRNPKLGVPSFFSILEVTRINNSSASITLRNAGAVEMGDTFLFVGAKEDTKALLSVLNSKEISFKNIKVHTSPFQVLVADNSDIILDEFFISPKGKRLFSASGKGITLRNNRKGAWIQNSNFETIGGDVLTVESDFLRIKKILNDKEVILKNKNNKGLDLRKGDVLGFFKEDTGEKIAELEIARKQDMNRTDYLISFSENTALFHLSRKERKKIQVYNLSQNSRGLKMIDSKFKRNHANGIVVFSANTVEVKNVEFEKNAKYSLKFQKDIMLGKGFVINNIRIENCNFKESYTGRNAYERAYSSIIFNNLTRGKENLFHTAVIQNNYFKQKCDISAMIFQNTSNFKIEDNRIEVPEKCASNLDYFVQFLDQNTKLKQKNNYFVK